MISLGFRLSQPYFQFSNQEWWCQTFIDDNFCAMAHLNQNAMISGPALNTSAVQWGTSVVVHDSYLSYSNIFISSISKIFRKTRRFLAGFHAMQRCTLAEQQCFLSVQRSTAQCVHAKLLWQYISSSRDERFFLTIPNDLSLIFVWVFPCAVDTWWRFRT